MFIVIVDHVSINVAAVVNEDAEREGPSSDMNAFREIFAKAKHILVLTGAGISAESGVPTFRGAGGYWRKYQVLTCFHFFFVIIL